MMTTAEREIVDVANRHADINDPDLHLQRLLAKDTSKPWFVTIIDDIREFLFPPKLPPLEVTSKPVAVKDIWGFYEGNKGRSRMMSFGIHVGVVLLVIFLGTNEKVQTAVRDTATVFIPDISPYMSQSKPKAQAMGGGGGGGDRSPLPAAKGQLPKPAPKQFVPPAQVINNPEPKLAMVPTIEIQPDAQLPQTNLPQWGDPLAKIGPPSNGPGSGSGIGSGSGGGIGSGKGAGLGPGSGGGMGGGAYRIGGGVSAPALLSKVEPEYSEEARKAKFQGTVVLQIVVDETGKARDIRVVRPLGLGLDEKAIEAVQKWRFRPGMLNGKPVPVQATIEVNFRLL
ncbi:MAG: energy transducer TonB [Bryobacteraceae bacterium]